MENNSPTTYQRFTASIRQQWQPKPIEAPKPDPDLEKLTGIQRSAEVMRYSILSFEFWISPKGQLREWVRKHTLFAVVLAVPVFLILPIITFALWQFVSWVIALNTIAGKLIVLPLLLATAFVTCAAALALLKAVLRR